MGRINEWERAFLSNIADRWSLSSRQLAVETGLRRHLASRLRFRGVALVSPAQEGFENEATEDTRRALRRFAASGFAWIALSHEDDGVSQEASASR